MGDKVKYGVRKVHYAMFTDEAETTYDTPVPMPGAKALGLEPQGEITTIYADGVAYFRASANNGYAGDLEVLYVPAQFLKDVYGYKEGPTSKVLVENANAQPKNFALLFEEEGDVSGTKFAMYKCSATRPKRELKTKEDKVDPTTQTISITMLPDANGDIFAMTQETTPAEVVNGWYTSVYKEASQPTQTQAG